MSIGIYYICTYTIYAGLNASFFLKLLFVPVSCLCTIIQPWTCVLLPLIKPWLHCCSFILLKNYSVTVVMYTAGPVYRAFKDITWQGCLLIVCFVNVFVSSNENKPKYLLSPPQFPDDKKVPCGRWARQALTALVAEFLWDWPLLPEGSQWPYRLEPQCRTLLLKWGQNKHNSQTTAPFLFYMNIWSESYTTK